MKNKSFIKIFLAFMLVFGAATIVTDFGTSHHAYAADGDFDVPKDISTVEDNDSPVQNLGSWVADQLKYLYALLVAVVAIVFVVKHEYSKLVSFLVIAIIVAIPIFAPDALPSIAQAISKALTGD